MAQAAGIVVVTVYIQLQQVGFSMLYFLAIHLHILLLSYLCDSRVVVFQAPGQADHSCNQRVSLLAYIYI